MYLNGENVEYVIRDLVVAEKVSEVAASKKCGLCGCATAENGPTKRNRNGWQGYRNSGFSRCGIKNLYDCR